MERAAQDGVVAGGAVAQWQVAGLWESIPEKVSTISQNLPFLEIPEIT